MSCIMQYFVRVCIVWSRDWNILNFKNFDLWPIKVEIAYCISMIFNQTYDVSTQKNPLDKTEWAEHFLYFNNSRI